MWVVFVFVCVWLLSKKLQLCIEISAKYCFIKEMFTAVLWIFYAFITKAKITGFIKKKKKRRGGEKGKIRANKGLYLY